MEVTLFMEGVAGCLITFVASQHDTYHVSRDKFIMTVCYRFANMQWGLATSVTFAAAWTARCALS